MPVVPRDGGTGLTDGAVPLRGGIVVDVKRMNADQGARPREPHGHRRHRHQHAQAQRAARAARAVLPRRPGVVPLLAGRRPHRHQRLVADRLALRPHPRPGAQLRPRAPHRRGDARRRRHRAQGQQVLQRLPAQAPVHGPPGHARHRHRGHPQALPQAGGGALAVLGVRQLRRRLRLRRRAGPRRGRDLRRGGAVRRVEGRLPAPRRRGLHPPARRRAGAGVRGDVRLRGRGAARPASGCSGSRRSTAPATSATRSPRATGRRGTTATPPRCTVAPRPARWCR